MNVMKEMGVSHKKICERRVSEGSEKRFLKKEKRNERKGERERERENMRKRET